MQSTRDLVVDRSVAEQVEMAHFITDPLMIGREGQRASGLRVESERAVERHEAVADQPVRE